MTRSAQQPKGKYFGSLQLRSLDCGEWQAFFFLFFSFFKNGFAHLFCRFVGISSPIWGGGQIRAPSFHTHSGWFGSGLGDRGQGQGGEAGGSMGDWG